MEMQKQTQVDGRATLNGEELENFAQNEHEIGIKSSTFTG